jgi:hypothetical protein
MPHGNRNRNRRGGHVLFTGIRLVRVTTTALDALKRDLQTLMDEGKLCRIVISNVEGQRSVYSFQMDAEFMNSGLESFALGHFAVSCVLRTWHRAFTAEERASTSAAAKWISDAFEGDPSSIANGLALIGEGLNTMCRREKAVIESRAYIIHGNECERVPAKSNMQSSCTHPQTGEWLGKEPGVTYA